MQTVQEFFEGILGLRWRELVPADWALPSFDWSHLGEFGERCLGGAGLGSAPLAVPPPAASCSFPLPGPLWRPPPLLQSTAPTWATSWTPTT